MPGTDSQVTTASQVRSSRILTARAMSRAIQECPAGDRPRVFVQISGVGYYPADDGKAVYDESSPGGAGDFFAGLARDWEDAARLPADCSGVRQVFVRSGVVLGRRGGMIGRLFLPFYLGAGGPVGSGAQPFPWIHLKDLTGLIAHAVERDGVSGVLNGVAPQTVTNAEFASAFGSALWRPAFVPLPAFVVNLVFGSERGSILLSGQKVVCP